MQQVNSNLLLIVWYLLKESNNKNNISTEEGNEWLYINFYPILESKTFDFNQILSIIIELIEKGIIEEIFLNPNDDLEGMIPYASKQTLDKINQVDSKIPFIIIAPPEPKDVFELRENEDEDLSCTMVFRKEKANQYIDEYLKKWENDKFYFADRNGLKAELQLEKVVEDIVRDLERFPKEMLIVTWSPLEKDIDFIAAMFFLEKIHAIEIINYLVTYTTAFRINIKNGFFNFFKKRKQTRSEIISHGIKVNFDFDRLKNNQNKNIKRITFNPPKTLNEGKTLYELKEGCIPLILLKLAQDSNNNVSWDGLQKKTGQSRVKIEKSLNNFQRKLRDKFNFPETEKFLKREGGKIIFNKDIFIF